VSAEELEDLGGVAPLFDDLSDDRKMLQRISEALATLAQKEVSVDRNARLNLMAGWLLGFAARYRG